MPARPLSPAPTLRPAGPSAARCTLCQGRPPGPRHAGRRVRCPAAGSRPFLLRRARPLPHPPPPQTPKKLYLVLDFINGGHLFFQVGPRLLRRLLGSPAGRLRGACTSLADARRGRHPAGPVVMPPAQALRPSPLSSPSVHRSCTGRARLTRRWRVCTAQRLCWPSRTCTPWALCTG